jgi:hypothetical protein
MTQPYPFRYTADTWHAKASAAKRLRSNGLGGDQTDNLLEEGLQGSVDWEAFAKHSFRLAI